MGEQIARSVRKILDSLDTVSWEELWYLFDAVFVDEVASEVFESVLSACALGTLGPPGPSSALPFDTNARRENSIIDPGDPPSRVPGLLQYVRRESHHQYRLLIRSEQDPLSRMGLRKIIDEGSALPFTALRRGILLDDMEPGSTMVLVGPSKSGKTYVLVEDIITPALEAGVHVIGNVEILDQPENYHHVTTVSDFFLTMVDLTIKDIAFLATRDEGILGRGRSRAQARRNQEMAMLTMVFRKFSPAERKQGRRIGGEVNVYQREKDVASELLDFHDHFIEKPSKERQDLAFIKTPSLKRIAVAGIPGDGERERLGWKTHPFRNEVSILAHDVDLLSLLEYQPRSPDGMPLPFKERLVALRDRILTMKGKVDRSSPLSPDQFIRLIIAFHLDNTKNGYRRYYELVEEEWNRAGVRSEDGVYKICKDLNIKSHPDRYDEWCGWCQQNRERPPPAIPRPGARAL